MKKINNKKMQNSNSKFKKNLPNIFLAIFFIIGLCIFIYPSASDLINNYLQNKELNEYQSKVSEISHDEYEKIIKEAQDYNSSLVRKNINRKLSKCKKHKL